MMHTPYKKILEILDFVLYSILKLSRFQNNSSNHNQHFLERFLQNRRNLTNFFFRHQHFPAKL